jgi:hypothetical protein
MSELQEVLGFERIRIENEGKSGVVVLFPLTRIMQENQIKWKKILEIAADSNILALVVIDKTEGAVASDFFNGLSSNFRIYIIRRDPREAIHKSQSLVTLSENLWMIQFHDDDDWFGKIELPHDRGTDEVFLVNFSHNGKTPRTDLEINPPGRVMFSLLPSSLWNKYCEFLKLQGSKSSPSADFTLMYIVETFYKKRIVKNFTYVYLDHHWEKGKKSRILLKRLSYEDGWGLWASVEIALFNRSIETIAALGYFSGGKLEGGIKSAIQHSIRMLHPRLRKRLLLRAKVYSYSISLRIFKVSRLLNRRELLYKKLVSKYCLHKFLITSWGISDISQLAKFIESFIQTECPDVLRNRFEFFLDNILQMVSVNSGINGELDAN